MTTEGSTEDNTTGGKKARLESLESVTTEGSTEDNTTGGKKARLDRRLKALNL